MKPKHIKKDKTKFHYFTVRLDKARFLAANEARDKLGYTWPFVINCAMESLVREFHEANPKAEKVKRRK